MPAPQSAGIQTLMDAEREATEMIAKARKRTGAADEARAWTHRAAADGAEAAHTMLARACAAHGQQRRPSA